MNEIKVSYTTTQETYILVMDEDEKILNLLVMDSNGYVLERCDQNKFVQKEKNLGYREYFKKVIKQFFVIDFRTFSRFYKFLKENKHEVLEVIEEAIEEIKKNCEEL